MGNVMVFDYEVRDPVSGGWKVGPGQATAGTIVRRGWRIVAGSGRQVFATSLAYDGMARRAPVAS